MVYAGFWRRFAALFIDGLIMLIPAVVANMILPYAGGIVIALLYRPVFESSEIRGTPGKLMMGLQVLTEAGERLSFQTALVRYLLSLVSGAVLCLGYLFNLFTAKRQTFHDLLAGTVVVREAVSTDIDWVGVWKRQFLAVMNWGESCISSGGETSSHSSAGAMATIENLHKLFQQGAISEAEYNAKKEELLKRI